MERFLTITICLILGACTPAVPVAQPNASSGTVSTEAFSDASKEIAHVAPSPEEITVESLSTLPIQGTDFTIHNTLEENAVYTRYAITYKANSLTVSGVLNVPKGKGPFPLVVLAHGYIDPRIYQSGRGLKREQNYLARQGFAVLHVDYRGHADSDPNPDNRIHGNYYGYAVDVLGAIDAVKRAKINIDASHASVLGHSLGGGIAMLAAVSHPSMIHALVLYAPISGNAWNNFQRWESKDHAGQVALGIMGTPQTNGPLWNSMSASSYFDRLKAPVKIFHGTEDTDVPYAWSQETEEQLKSAGKLVNLTSYAGEHHEFTTRWNDFIKATAKFLKDTL